MMKLINYVRLLAFTASLSYGYSQYSKDNNYFDELNYEPMYKQFGRRFNERSMALFIEFEAFGRTFKLIVGGNTSSIATGKEKMYSYNRRVQLYPNSVVAGKTLADGDLSGIRGWITKSGLFYGTLKSGNLVFFIEPAKKYFKKPTFHSIVYRRKDKERSLKDTQDSFELDLKFSQHGSRKRTRHRGKRRASADAGVKRDVKTCRLSLEADYTFLEMSGSPLRAISSMVDHIGSLNKIFRKSFVNSDSLVYNESKFTQQGNDSDVSFQIAKVRVYNETETSRVFRTGGLDAATFLRVMQQSEDYSQYCLALFFTARSFIDGVLGVANPRGLCTNLNVGVVSFTREGVVLPPPVTEIAVAHVVGHAFGAKHDEDSCEQDVGKHGDFIMTKFGLNGDQPNNLYSPCSVQDIKSFVKTLQGTRCLDQRPPEEHLCGNGVVENDEECDCGGREMCSVLEPGNCCNFTSCKLRTHAVCSVSNGFCCDGQTCNYKITGDVCLLESECSHQAVCSGNTSICPQPSPKEKFLDCNRNTSVCINGVCSGKSACEKFGFKSCFCKNKQEECKVCCVSERKCRPAENISKKFIVFTVNEHKNICRAGRDLQAGYATDGIVWCASVYGKIKSRLQSIYLGAGSLCANKRGYCDMFHKCHPINLNAPFSHRYDPYFRKKGMKEITHSFWWAIFLGTVGLLTLVFMIIKHGALYTKSSCPKLNELEPAKQLPRFKLSRLKDEERGIILNEDIVA